MSWNINGRGSKKAVLAEIDRYFTPLRKQGGNAEKEYGAAASALQRLVDSAPDDDHLIEIDACGGAGYEKEWPAFEAVVRMRLLTATIRE